MVLSKMMTEVQSFAAILLQIVIAARMYSRGLHEKVKFFFAYIIWQTISTAILYFILHFKSKFESKNVLFGGYWVNNVITISLGMVIIFELFNRIFEPYEGIRRFGRIILFWSSALLMIIGGILATFNEVAFSVPVWTVLLVAERSLRIIQLGLILVLFSVSRYLHLRWKNYLFGIALGFGFYALVALTGLTIRMYYGKSVFGVVDTLLGTAYCAAVVIWTFYILQPDVLGTPIITLPSHELDRWDHTLSQLLRRSSSSPISAANE
jgi:hypothetical protein